MPELADIHLSSPRRRLDNGISTGQSQAEFWHSNHFFRNIVDGNLEEVQKWESGKDYFNPLTRGSEGETILHVAILLMPLQEGERRTKLLAIALHLIKTFPCLVFEKFTQDRYYGETCLQLAAGNGDLDLVKALLGEYINKKQMNDEWVDGDEFMPDEFVDPQTKGVPGFLYNGGSALSFAATAGHPKIVEYLLQNGASPEAQDKFGNNVFHAMAYWGHIGNYEKKTDGSKSCWTVIKEFCNNHYAIKSHPAKKPNHKGLTPFLLAIERGHIAALDDLMEPLWTFGSGSCYRFAVEEIDTWQPNSDTPYVKYNEELCVPCSCKSGDINKCYCTTYVIKSALEVAASKGEGHAKLLQHPTMKLILRSKWERFGRELFLWDLAIHVIAIICLSINIANMATNIEDRKLGNFFTSNSPSQVIRVSSFIASCVMMLVLSVRELFEFRVQGAKLYFCGVGGHENAVTIIFVTSYIAAVASQFCFSYDSDVGLQIENALFGFSAFLGWISLLFFAKGHEHFGPLMIILYNVIIGDLLKWFIIWGVGLLGFGHVLFLQMQKAGQFENDKFANNITDVNYGLADWQNWRGSMVNTARITLGQSSYDDLRNSITPVIGLPVYIFYNIFSVILLLNLLIALLGHSFSKIYDDAKSRWYFQWANLVLEQDARIPSEHINDDGIKGSHFFGINKPRLGVKTPISDDYIHYMTVRQRKVKDEYVTVKVVINQTEEWRYVDSVWEKWRSVKVGETIKKQRNTDNRNSVGTHSMTYPAPVMANKKLYL